MRRLHYFWVHLAFEHRHMMSFTNLTECLATLHLCLEKALPSFLSEILSVVARFESSDRAAHQGVLNSMGRSA